MRKGAQAADCCGRDPYFAPFCRRLSRHRAICGRRVYRAGHGGRADSEWSCGAAIASCSAPARWRMPPAPAQAAAGWDQASSVMAVGEILLARSAPRSLLAVSGPVSEYDRSPGMIGEKAARMILAAATQTLRYRILGGGNRCHRDHSKAPARTPMSRSSR